ncbi:zeta toxin family protein [Streptomyces sp. NPDC127079]|uniref:zeta toxin family protein n=1 Tax=Streptomyces sp. NPDC127079 TaxID=3347132 RepID=UPI0036678DDA
MSHRSGRPLSIVRRAGFSPRDRNCTCGTCSIFRGAGGSVPVLRAGESSRPVSPLGELSRTDIEEIFEQIRADYEPDVVRQTAPCRSVIVAQPGAGKSQLMPVGTAGATRVSGDDFKIYHPGYLGLLAADPRTAGARIRSVYQEWQWRLEERVRALRGHLVSENSPGPVCAFLDDLAAFRHDGYRVELVVLAVRRADSRQGIGLRYADMLRTEAALARFTWVGGHDECFEAVADVLAAVEQESAADAVSVVRRGGAVLHRGERESGGRLGGGAVAALLAERRRPYTCEEAAAFLVNHERLCRELPQYRDEWEEVLELATPLMSLVN